MTVERPGPSLLGPVPSHVERAGRAADGEEPTKHHHEDVPDKDKRTPDLETGAEGGKDGAAGETKVEQRSHEEVDYLVVWLGDGLAGHGKAAVVAVRKRVEHAERRVDGAARRGDGGVDAGGGAPQAGEERRSLLKRVGQAALANLGGLLARAAQLGAELRADGVVRAPYPEGGDQDGPAGHVEGRYGARRRRESDGARDYRRTGYEEMRQLGGVERVRTPRELRDL
mmetsp:Transcript_3810/g.11248  ORF Transcript_3810/g.11248 Transcript_3810/m.11248 type:complete len:227 (-) Transcript_3810:184-864(-)